MWPDETPPMLLPESGGVYIPSFRSVVSRISLAKVPFLAFFWLPDTNTERSVAFKIFFKVPLVKVIPNIKKIIINGKKIVIIFLK